MVALTCHWRSSTWIRIGCLIGLAACQGCSQTPRVFPGDKEYAEGYGHLAAGKLAIGKSADVALNEAIQAFDKAIDKNPGNFLAYFHRAKAYQLRGKTAYAIKDFGKALSLNPEHADSYCGRAAAYLEQGSFRLAIDDLTKASDLVPNSYSVFSLRTRANLLAGKCAYAIEDARSAIRLNAEGGDTLGASGRSIPPSPNRQPERDVDYIIKAIQPDKTLTTRGKADLARAYWNLGMSLTGRRLEAEKAFGEARRLDLNYDNLYAEYQGGRNLYVAYQERTDRAKRGRIEHTTAFWPSDATLPQLKYQATDALKQEMFDIAIAQFTHILEIDAKATDVWVWCGRGSAYLGKNDPDSAIPDFERAIDLDPKFAEAYYLRGQAYAKKGFYSQTILDSTQSIHLQPDRPQAYFQRAVAYFKKNDFEHALADLDEAVRLDPKSEVQTRSSFAGICVGQGTACIAERHWDKAIASLETAISADKNGAGQLNRQLALAYGERGYDRANRNQFHEAVSDLNNALDLDKDNAQIYRFCGLTCCMMAKDCHGRGPAADEKEQWENAIRYLKWAIWLDPGLKRKLQDWLEDAQGNLH
ncbi:MAG: tetratricopeptide repeat protein [Thermoguttaceae bacterium]